LTNKEKLIGWLESCGITFVLFDNFDRITDIFSRSFINKLQFAPFNGSVAIAWKDKIILTMKDASWPSILHEAGHILCNSPPGEDEFHFLGWEVSVVRYLKLSMKEWMKDNSGYIIDYKDGDITYETIGDLKDNTSSKNKFFYEIRKTAVQDNLITNNYKPRGFRC
jgi:hypothetical protein